MPELQKYADRRHFAGFVEDLMKLQPHKFQLGQHGIALCTRKGEQDFIVNVIAVAISSW